MEMGLKVRRILTVDGYARDRRLLSADGGLAGEPHRIVNWLVPPRRGLFFALRFQCEGAP